MKTFSRWIGNILLIFLVVCAGLSVVSFIRSKKNNDTIPNIGPYKFMAVLSGSMSPTFNVYDMIVDKKISTESVKKGDVITFRQDDKNIVTHRVIDIESKDGKVLLKTKGDANNVEDDAFVDSSKVEGIYLLRIPYGGLVVSKLRGPIGFVIVWILSIYVILSEILFNKGKDKTAATEVKDTILESQNSNK